MDNRYLFRGKRSDIGEWVEGYLFQHLKSTCILPLEAKESTHTYFFDYAFDVDPSTLGQCTGLKDKRGKLIFEGDILRGDAYPFLSDGKHNYNAEVVWFDDCPAFGLYTVNGYCYME